MNLQDYRGKWLFQLDGISQQTWHHVGVTFTGQEQPELRLILNGCVVQRVQRVNQPISGTQLRNLYVGCKDAITSVSHCANAMVDELYIWESVIKDSEMYMFAKGLIQ